MIRIGLEHYDSRLVDLGHFTKAFLPEIESNRVVQNRQSAEWEGIFVSALATF